MDSVETLHPGSEPLRNDRHERFARMRALDMGLDKPVKVAETDPDGGPPVVSDLDRARAVAVLLVRAQLAAADSETASPGSKEEATQP